MTKPMHVAGVTIVTYYATRKKRVDFVYMRYAMDINLSLEVVDNLIDASLCVRSDITYRRRLYKNPPKLVYTVNFQNQSTKPWKIMLYQLDSEITHINFPINIPNFKVDRVPLFGGAIRYINAGPVPIFDNPFDEAKKQICYGILGELKLVSQSALDPRIKKLPRPKPPLPKKEGGNIDDWFIWYHEMLDNGFKCTLEMVAENSGYSLGYIKQKHIIFTAKTYQKT